MSAALLALLLLTIAATSFLSGVFGMAGGMILMGFLLVVLPLPAAMVLHAVTQMASNGWRALLWRRYIRWRPVAWYLTGSLVALAIWSAVRLVPSKPVALILLGGTPFLVLCLPARARPDPENRWQGLGYGTIATSLLIVTGVAGPLIDRFFLGGTMDRREMVASKSACQVAGHLIKLFYFGSLVDGAAGVDPLLAAAAVACSMLGTTLARRVLEAMSDRSFRLWTNRIIVAVSLWLLGHGGFLLATGQG